MSECRPFLINGNLPLSDADVADYETLMRSVAGNVGNSYISYALIKEVCGAYRSVPQIQSIYTYDFANAARDAEFINSECSHVFLVLQDQIRLQESYGLKLPYDQIIRFLKQIQKPIVIAGLGANSFTGFDAHFHEKLPSDLVAFLRDLSGLVKNMGVRGDFTHEVLNRLGIKNVTTIGCPSYYENGASRRIVKRGFANLACSTNVATDLMLRSAVYLQDQCAHEERMIRALAFGEPCPLTVLEKILYSENRLRFFSSIPEWKVDLATHDFFIGTRVHGSIVALNSGVPSVVMNGDSRAREMCEYLNIPYHPELGGESDPQLIYEQCDYEKMNREYGQKWVAYRDFLRRFDVSLASPSGGRGQPPLTDGVLPKPPVVGHVIRIDEWGERRMKILDRTGAASEALTPAFGERGIAVAFFADLNYFPYVAVAVRSIVETASSENSYDVLVFTDADVGTPIRERLLDVTRGCSNVSLRLVVLDAADLLSIKGLFVGGLSSMTYGRLLLPTLLADYRRAIYLDVDVVVREDLAHLFAIDLKGNLVGAVKDEGVVRCSVPPIWREGVLKVCPDFDFDRYVNAGLLLMDLDGLRREKSMMRALELSARNQFLFCDQDAVNISLRDRILQLPRLWNQCTNALPVLEDGVPDVLGARTGIAHYASRKPWQEYSADSPDWMWWDVASRTSYHQEFVFALAQKKVDQLVRAARERSNRLAHAKVLDLLRLWILTREDNRLANGKRHSFIFAPWLEKWRSKLMRRGILSRSEA